MGHSILQRDMPDDEDYPPRSQQEEETSYGDHIHTCKQHTRSTKAAHETILDALEKICAVS